MKVLQIENGGGLDSTTNSSFYIETSEGRNILFDCGRNVFDELQKKRRYN
jgi:ribonuclease BN (tRNA processing enzyme)